MAESRKPRRGAWRHLAPPEMAAHLLNTPTIADSAWTRERRLPGETRVDFVHRILLGEATTAEPQMPTAEPEFTPQPELAAAEAAELVALHTGYYLLNADGGHRRGYAAIGALLRVAKGRLITVDHVSMPIGPATHNV